MKWFTIASRIARSAYSGLFFRPPDSFSQPLFCVRLYKVHGFTKQHEDITCKFRIIDGITFFSSVPTCTVQTGLPQWAIIGKQCACVRKIPCTCYQSKRQEIFLVPFLFGAIFKSVRQYCKRIVRLPTSAQPLHLAVVRYAFDETTAHLLNNRTKSVESSKDLGLSLQHRMMFRQSHTISVKLFHFYPYNKTLF